MTRKQLEKALAKIGWKVDKSSNGLNDFIINHKGERTSFVVYNGQIEVRGHIFGCSTNDGTIYLDLEDMDVVAKRLYGVYFVTLNLSRKNFISFYNHNQNPVKRK